ncbi:MAG TPA: polyphosphate:AMP phosphotransferase [Burkholderiales bacterium]|nr:polyphosphate:AMP phosphotransferase [Burkholderiales bacterium]
MFESAELGHAISPATYARAVPKLREALLDAQYDLFQDGRFPVMILIAGIDGAGKGETVNLLNEWMDPRHINVAAFGESSDEERERPPMWRYWRELPPRGRIGIFFGHWYTDPILDRVHRKSRQPELIQSIEEIVRFEKMLADEGALLLKFWFHLTKDKQKKRLKALEKDPQTRWRVTKTEWRHFRLYDRIRKVAGLALRHTGSAAAPWFVVEGQDACYRNLTVGRTLLAAMRERLDQKPAKPAADRIPPIPPPIDNRHILGALDLGLKLTRRQYTEQRALYQGRIYKLSRHPRFRERSAVLVFEGNDAAGKGGAIRRVAAALDARYYRTIPVAAPTEEERAQPYLWRFWRHLPRLGRFVLFDRSWYGRVLVERVEGFAGEFDWTRAYSEINDFEQQLADKGAIVVKFWLAISKDEQYRRFRERQKTAFKRFKITPEDWRNRKKWEAYEQAVCDMVDRTSTAVAPWTLVEANDKRYARIKVLKTICERLESALRLQ